MLFFFTCIIFIIHVVTYCIFSVIVVCKGKVEILSSIVEVEHLKGQNIKLWQNKPLLSKMEQL